MQRNEMLASISASNDLDFYYNVKNVDNQYIIDIITEHFDNGERQDHEFTSLEFLNLLWEQANFVQTNIKKAHTVITKLKSLLLDDEEKHILFGFILLYKQGGYPVINRNLQYFRTYGFIETAFLSYEGNTPEKIICQNDWHKISGNCNIRDKFIDTSMINTAPKTYKLNENETRHREEFRLIVNDIVKGKTDKQALELIETQYEKLINKIIEANNTVTASKLMASQAYLMMCEIKGRKGIKEIKDRNEANPKEKKINEAFEIEMAKPRMTRATALNNLERRTDLGIGGTDPKNRKKQIHDTLKSFGLALKGK